MANNVDGIAQLVLDDLMAKAGTLPLLLDKHWTIVDPEDLFNKAVALPYPAVGVVYEGIGSESNVASGRDSFMKFGIVLAYQVGTIGKRDFKPQAIALLDSLRDVILGKKSPTCRPWLFVSESPADNIDNTLIYYQRWRTKVIL